MKIFLSFAIACCVFVYILFFSITTSFVYSLTKPAEIDVVVTPAPIVLDDRKLWSIIQEWRKSEGLAEYREDELLCDIADKRIIELDGKSGDDFNHDGFFKYPKQTNFLWVSENITGASSELMALDNWLNSPAHREALEDKLPYSCVRCKSDFCVQLFAR